MLFELILRSYAPFRRFGGVYKGDGRGPTTSPKVTSRVKAWVTFDPAAGIVGKPSARSDASHFAIGPSWTAIGIPVGRVAGVRAWKNGVYFQLHASGSNPLFPGAPSIDVHVGITASVAPGRLDLSASLTGDGFPNAELMVQDVTGVRRMIMTFETTGGPDTGPLRLMGDSRGAMNAISTYFDIDEAGHFVGDTLMCTSALEVQ